MRGTPKEGGPKPKPSVGGGRSILARPSRSAIKQRFWSKIVVAIRNQERKVLYHWRVDKNIC